MSRSIMRADHGLGDVRQRRAFSAPVNQLLKIGCRGLTHLLSLVIGGAFRLLRRGKFQEQVAALSKEKETMSPPADASATRMVVTSAARTDHVAAPTTTVGMSLSEVLEVVKLSQMSQEVQTSAQLSGTHSRRIITLKDYHDEVSVMRC